MIHILEGTKTALVQPSKHPNASQPGVFCRLEYPSKSMVSQHWLLLWRSDTFPISSLERWTETPWVWGMITEQLCSLAIHQSRCSTTTILLLCRKSPRESLCRKQTYYATHFLKIKDHHPVFHKDVVLPWRLCSAGVRQASLWKAQLREIWSNGKPLISKRGRNSWPVYCQYLAYFLFRTIFSQLCPNCHHQHQLMEGKHPSLMHSSSFR